MDANRKFPLLLPIFACGPSHPVKGVDPTTIDRLDITISAPVAVVNRLALVAPSDSKWGLAEADRWQSRH
jgi:hypothetical protein